MWSAASQELKALPERAYAPGDSIIRAGTRTGALYFLEQGRVAIVRGGVTVTRIRQRGAVFGEMSLLLGTDHTADVVALDEVRCRVADDGASFVMTRPALMGYVAAVLAHRLDAATRYLVDVKAQFAESGGHLGMIDDVLDTLASRHPSALRDAL
jgi:CRP-like cAMP-binding protein